MCLEKRFLFIPPLQKINSIAFPFQSAMDKPFYEREQRLNANRSFVQKFSTEDFFRQKIVDLRINVKNFQIIMTKADSIIYVCVK